MAVAQGLIAGVATAVVSPGNVPGAIFVGAITYAGNLYGCYYKWW